MLKDRGLRTENMSYGLEFETDDNIHEHPRHAPIFQDKALLVALSIMQS